MKRLTVVTVLLMTLAVGSATACTTVVVGRHASATGRILLGHNEDNKGEVFARHAMLPAEAGKARRYWAEMKSRTGKAPIGDLYYNEHGVIVFSNNGGVVDEWEGRGFVLPDEGDASALTDGGVGERIRLEVSEHAHSAREGVMIVTNLVSRFGYSMASRIFTVADRNEAWMVEVVRGRRFVARRCPDDAVCVFPNCLTIGRTVPDDIVSEHVRSKGPDFDFIAAYQGPRTWRSPYNLHRWQDLYRLVTGVDVSDARDYPFAVRPVRKVTVEDIQKGLGSHYEGQPWAVVDPRHPEEERTLAICRASTVESTVCAMGETPDETDLHVATGRPCETPYVRYRPFAGILPPDVTTGDEAVRRQVEHDDADWQHPELPRRLTGETPEQQALRLSWWQQARFGMFIHFGLYSVPAGVCESGPTDLGEWIRSRQYLTNEQYDSEFLPRFNPDLFDARAWARAAKRAGMKYVVLTTKHHEGFCMWDTATTGYKITKTEFGRDLVREYVDALREEGLGVGFYYSIIDWHHPHFTVDYTHPLRPRDRREWTHAKLAELNRGRDMDRYRDYMFAQVRELLTRYGKIDIIWYDYTARYLADTAWGKSYRDYDAIRLLKMTRELQPGAIIDNRLDLMDTDDGWDFVTPEQFKVAEWPKVRGRQVPWETCQTFSGSWGYCRDQDAWKSVPQLIKLLSETVSKGGNLIMNVGPTARGEFDERALARLDGFARWMHGHARSIYGCTAAPAGIVAPNGTAVTYNPKTNRAYVHVYDYPMGLLPIEWVDRVEYAQFLHDGSKVVIARPYVTHPLLAEVRMSGGFRLPVRKPSVDVPVVEVWLKNQ